MDGHRSGATKKLAIERNPDFHNLRLSGKTICNQEIWIMRSRKPASEINRLPSDAFRVPPDVTPSDVPQARGAAPVSSRYAGAPTPLAPAYARAPWTVAAPDAGAPEPAAGSDSCAPVARPAVRADAASTRPAQHAGVRCPRAWRHRSAGAPPAAPGYVGARVPAFAPHSSDAVL